MVVLKIRMLVLMTFAALSLLQAKAAWLMCWGSRLQLGVGRGLGGAGEGGMWRLGVVVVGDFRYFR